MINAEFLWNKEHRLTGFRIIGHAGYADKGFDIVCSAVSVLTINTVNSIGRLTDDYYTFDKNENEGFMLFEVKELSDSSEILLRSMRIGLESIAEEYGNEFISIK
ncbi:MAG: ribosomal-processing cysteine protease Prp [Lachnospiraceae bacterium]|nr:ribosomal-processing cysteine protease Prp [Lachnospiraceae bacterium]